MGRLATRRLLLLAGALLVVAGVGVVLSGRVLPPGGDDVRLQSEPADSARASAGLRPGGARGLTAPDPIVAPEATARIRVTVSGGWGDKRVAGALVTIGTRSGEKRVASTDADGLAIFEAVPAGEVHVSVSAAGYANARDYGFALKANEERQIGEPLSPAETLRGNVLDAADGRPIAEAVVTAFEGGPVNMNPGGPPSDRTRVRLGDHVVITRGGTPFGASLFSFGVFRTSRTLGKQNGVDDGEINALDGPGAAGHSQSDLGEQRARARHSVRMLGHPSCGRCCRGAR